MKTWAVTIRTDIKSKTDICFNMRAYSRSQIMDMLGDLYWIMELDEVDPRVATEWEHGSHPFYEENTNAT